MTQEEFFKRYSYNLRQDKLGGGAFGTVYKAYDNYKDIYVAIKVSEVKIYGDKEFSLLEEYDTVKNLPPHPNVAVYEEVYTFETPYGIFDYAILQYYPDGNLSDLIKKGILTPEQKESIALQILEGLSFLHKHNVVHRDMKPSNILMHKREDGQYIPKIADFGLSKFTNYFNGEDLKYCSPEQLKGLDLRFNTDLWAWTVIAYELFTGEMLFKPSGSHSTGNAEREKQLYEQILNKDVKGALKRLPKKWQEALAMCLVRNADDRAKTAEDLKEVLQGSEQDTDFATKILEPTESTDETTQILNPEIEKTQVVAVEESEVIIDEEYLKNKYDEIIRLSDGSAKVKLDGKWGYIDKRGEEVIPTKYEFMFSFSEGLVKVYLNKKFGFIDKTGKEVIPVKYDWGGRLSEGLAGVKLNGKWGFIDKTGKEVIPFRYDGAGEFSEGLAGVILNGKWGFIDKTGKEVIPFRYDRVGEFSEGFAKVKLDRKWGFVDKTGKKITFIKYDEVGEFSEGFAKVKLSWKWGFINEKGEEYWGRRKPVNTINDSKIEVSDKKFNYKLWVGVAIILFIIGLIFLNKTKYDNVYDFSEGLSAVELSGKWGFVDREGKEVIPLKYDYVGSFSNGLAKVKLNDKEGYIDKEGNQIIPVIYDFVWDFSEGIAMVQLDGERGYIDELGRMITLIKYDYGYSFSEGYAKVKLNGEWGFIDKEGKEYWY